MGAFSARIFEREDAGRLIRIDPGQCAGVDMGHPKLPAARRIEIGVENAGPAAELELEARPLADLERRMAEMTDKLVGGETDEAARLWRYRFGRRKLLDRLRRLLRTGRASGKRQSESGED